MTTLTEKKWNIETSIEAPLHWRKPRRVWITGDLFHDGHDDNLIDRVFAVMALSPQHTFMVLTKRPEWMREYMTRVRFAGDTGTPIHPPVSLIRAAAAAKIIGPTVRDARILSLSKWPLSNVWLGVSAEDQKRADERIPDLLATPAAKRFVSIEPMLGAIDLTRLHGSYGIGDTIHADMIVDALRGLSAAAWKGRETELRYKHLPCLDLIIVGGESGPGSQPMHPDWPRSLRDQCKAAGVPFFFKQWGEWAPTPNIINDTLEACRARGGRDTMFYPDGSAMELVGKRRAGRLLDGEEHNGEV